MKKIFLLLLVASQLLFPGTSLLFAQYSRAIPITDIENKKWGLAERYTMKIILRPQYQYITPLETPGYFQADNGTEDIIILDSTGKKTLHLKKDIVLFSGGGLLRYANKGNHEWYHVSGRKIKMDPKQIRSAAKCFDGRQMFTGVNGKEGFLDTYGRIIVKAVWDKVFGYENGYGAVSINNKWGLVNMKGQLAVPAVHEGVNAIGENRFAFLKNGKYAIGGLKKMFTDYEFDGLSAYSEGLATVQKGEQVWYVDTAGKNPFNKTYSSLSGFENGTAMVYDGTQFMTINRKGETLYSLPGHPVLAGFEGGRFIYVVDTLTQTVSVLNTAGKTLISTRISKPEQYMNGTIVITKNLNPCVINYKGEIIIPEYYAVIRRVPELNAWLVSGDTGSFYMDEKGNKYIQQ